MGNSSSAVLENALSERISDLEIEIRTLQSDKKSITQDNTKLRRDLQKVKGALSSLF